MQVSGQLHALAALPQGQTDHITHVTENSGLGGGLDRHDVDDKDLLLLHGIEPRFLACKLYVKLYRHHIYSTHFYAIFVRA